jgi:hypothetical protein
MSKNICKRLVTLLLPLFLISVLVFEPSSRAQRSGCPGNLLQNGDFATGVVGSGDFPPNIVPNWSLAFETPQVVAAMGCGTPGFIKMWGNKVVGEGIKQTVNIQAGHTYRLSACVRVDTSNPMLPKYVRFNVRASNGAINYTDTAPVAPTIGIIGDPTNTPSVPAPGITATTWTPITLASWTAPSNFNTITINPENDNTADDGNTVSWGWIDNVCLQDVPPPCTPPPTPVINGPNNLYAGQTATYSVSGLSLGVSYSWTVTGGTISGPATGTSVNVVWNGTGGTITVTATNKGGCSSIAKLPVSSDLFLCESCNDFQAKTDLTSFSHAGGGVYNVTPALSVNLSNVIRVTANVISSTATYAPLVCGTVGPVNSSVVSAANVSASGGVTLAAMVPLAGGHEVIWHGPPISVNGLSFPMKIKFPPPPTGKCTDALTFCIKYTFTTRDCRTCEVIRCYGPFKRNGSIKTAEEISNVNLTP